jgi:hypothetical protein
MIRYVNRLVAAAVLAPALMIALAACGRSSHTGSTGGSSRAPSTAGSATPSRSASSGSASSTASSPTGENPSGPAAATGALPRPTHIVVVMMENHSYSDVIGNASAPFINSLGDSGALFTQSFALTHPSQPNYIALFSGSTQGIGSDTCPNTIGGSSLGGQLLTSGRTFAGYSESLPQMGFSGCTSGSYARKHAPWVNFTSLPASTNRPFSVFPSNYDALPTVSFVIPNLENDMHDGTVAQGDQWL